MANEKDWTIVFYVDENGRRPVREFLQSLDNKTQARLYWSIEQLRFVMVERTNPWSVIWKERGTP